jgi:RNA polymerase sigma-70 factor (ECF subfamily)
VTGEGQAPAKPTKEEPNDMQHLLDRYSHLAEGRFHRKQKLDEDRSPQELARVIMRAKQGDQDALRYLYLRFADNVYGYARSIVRDEHEAEDVTQQVFTRLMSSIERYEQRSVPFSSWLLRITHNMAIDHIRRRRAVPCEDTFAVDEGQEERGADLSLVLRDALAELPEDQREVVVLRHVAGWSPGEIAEHLGKSEDSIHGLHHRGRRALKHELVQRDAAPVAVPA